MREAEVCGVDSWPGTLRRAPEGTPNSSFGSSAKRKNAGTTIRKRRFSFAGVAQRLIKKGQDSSSDGWGNGW